MPSADVRELFVHELGDIYDAEHRFLEGQREMAQEATDPHLEEAIQQDIQEAQSEAVRDCAINAAIIRVEHFEIGSYQGMLTGARQLGPEEAVNLLEENLGQEEQTAQLAER